MFSLEDIINLAVQLEENAERFFRDAATKVGSPSLVSLLHWLADEEVKHAGWFSELKPKVKKTVDDPKIEDMGKAILKGALEDQTFSLSDVDFSELDHIEELLKRAIEFEYDTILFYQMIMPFVEQEMTSDDINTIIKEEERHIRVLEEFLESRRIEMDDHT
jgi:rubrerythrin